LAVEMGSGAVIYVPSLIKIGSGIQKLIGEDTRTHIQTNKHRQQRDLISLFYFFKIRKVGSKYLYVDWRCPDLS
jgi:hypothetical protein